MNTDDDRTVIEPTKRTLLPSFQIKLSDLRLFSSAADFEPAMLAHRNTSYGLAVSNGILAFLQSVGVNVPATAVSVALNNTELTTPTSTSHARLLFDSRVVQAREKRRLRIPITNDSLSECGSSKTCDTGDFCNYDSIEWGSCEECGDVSHQDCYTRGLSASGEQDCALC